MRCTWNLSPLIYSWKISHVHMQFIFIFIFIEHSSLDHDADHLLLPVCGGASESNGVRGAAALQEDKHTHYSVSSTKQLQPKRPLDTLISERSLKGRGPRRRGRLLLLSPLISSEKPKKKEKNRHSERDSPSH